jgi:hypothetical protein
MESDTQEIVIRMICGRSTSPRLNSSKSTVKGIGEPDVVEVRQVFDDSFQAREWEHKVIRRMRDGP